MIPKSGSCGTREWKKRRREHVLPYKMLPQNHSMLPRDMGLVCDPSSMMFSRSNVIIGQIGFCLILFFPLPAIFGSALRNFDARIHHVHTRFLIAIRGINLPSHVVQHTTSTFQKPRSLIPHNFQTTAVSSPGTAS